MLVQSLALLMRDFPGGPVVKNLPANAGTQDDPTEKLSWIFPQLNKAHL